MRRDSPRLYTIGGDLFFEGKHGREILYGRGSQRASAPRSRSDKELFALRKQALAIWPDVWPVLEKAVNNGGSQKAGELLEVFARFQELVQVLQGLGCELKGVDPGLVDFPALRDG